MRLVLAAGLFWATAPRGSRPFTIDKSVPWQKSRDSQGDAPTLEFTSSDGKSLSFELHTFESGENVYDKLVRPLENLTLVDPNLKRRRS
ncbi:MAG: hypothetical protein ACXVJT_07715 [Thermoanaerobaculia bacterium]